MPLAINWERVSFISGRLTAIIYGCSFFLILAAKFTQVYIDITQVTAGIEKSCYIEALGYHEEGGKVSIDYQIVCEGTDQKIVESTGFRKRRKQPDLYKWEKQVNKRETLCCIYKGNLSKGKCDFSHRRKSELIGIKDFFKDMGAYLIIPMLIMIVCYLIASCMVF